ncbi:SDR family oxidoreductase [Microbacterium laevaniformans]|uniref:reductase n=1 Tax=Microbacterium laevaniformans TaxID=36807 RepID=UPI0019568927|nr:reductase [Microbacterium laevaniformans]MBM7752029.1 nucleoside-diphosphate-sugar epimerase [Microbacterium laevaniformans]GLJ65065.1 reductase [Microbacterium laevaniformans]
MTDVLILGGTGWLSGRIARRWRDAGAAVTVLARGGRDAPAGTRLVVADRERDDAYTAVADREWDVAGADESAALAVAAEPGDPYDYRREKAAAEQAVTAALGRRAAVVRPGLIVGQGDPTDRFGYGVARLAAAAAEPVLIPDAPGARVQVIDVDDLTDFVVEVGAARFTGAVNAVGDSLPLEAVLAIARSVAGHTGALVPASAPWLVAHGVGYWAGERSLPLWLPDDVPGFATRANGTYRILGGRHRPLEDVLRRVLADERERGLDRPRSAGLTRADERELLDALAQ